MIEKYRTFTYLITSINRFIKRIKTEEMAEFNLKSPHVSCLYYVYKVGAITARELCDLCGEDKASISRSLRFLEKQGYISNAVNEGKKYKSRIILTEKGMETGKIICRKVDAILTKASEGIEERDEEITYRTLQAVNDNLIKIYKDYNQE